MNDYKIYAEDHMRVKHDAKARITVKTGRQVLEDELTDIATVGGAMTRISFMYNRASMSGGVDWWNPANGQSITRPKVSIRLRESDILTDDELCDCERCLA